MMAFPGHNPDLFRWRRVGSANKIHIKKDDIDQWKKRVEMASELAVSEVFSHKKPQSGISSLAVLLQSTEQLSAHDEAYSEAQALLGDWLSNKLRRELEDEDDLMCSAEWTGAAASASPVPAALNYNNFDELYNCLVEEEEQSAVKGFLQDLMEQKLLDSRMMEDLALGAHQTRKRFRDPIVTMQARQQQVRENRAQREAELQRQQRERDVLQAAREEAKKMVREEEMRKRQEKRRQEEMVQQEMVRLRRQMEARRGLEQTVQQREKSRERAEVQITARNLHSAPTPLIKQHGDAKRLYQEQMIQGKVHMNNLKCLQRHFSRWYSVVLDRRLRMGKAMALYDWKRKLKAWRAWRGVVWAERKQREVARTEEALRIETRQCQLAAESDQRRLLRRCLNGWQLWCRTEKVQREILARQQEIKQKMADLISAASAGKLKATESPAYQPIMAPPEAPNRTTKKEDRYSSDALTPETSALPQEKNPVITAARPSHPWQVTRRHAVPTAAELHRAMQREEDQGGACARSVSVSSGGRFENRHAAQKQIIAQQRKLLKEQQEQITQLKEEQKMRGLEQEMERAAKVTESTMLGGLRPKSPNTDTREQRAPRGTGEPDSQSAPSRKAVTLQICPHPLITAMEARAHQRAERRKEIEELKRKKEEEKQAQMKAAEELRLKEEEEEKHRAAERRREERRLEKENISAQREEEKQRQLKRQQELMALARQHHCKTLLLRRGLAPWKRLIQLRQASVELAERHHNFVLLRRYTLGWQQSARESVSDKDACADQLHQYFLLRRSLTCFKRLRDMKIIQEERAERFYRTRTLRRFLLALLDHMTKERLEKWEREELALEHNDRRVLRQCFLAWRQLPCLLRKEREKDKRREKLCRKVTEVLPDFCSHSL